MILSECKEKKNNNNKSRQEDDVTTILAISKKNKIKQKRNLHLPEFLNLKKLTHLFYEYMR